MSWSRSGWSTPTASADCGPCWCPRSAAAAAARRGAVAGDALFGMDAAGRWALVRAASGAATAAGAHRASDDARARRARAVAALGRRLLAPDRARGRLAAAVAGTAACVFGAWRRVAKSAAAASSPASPASSSPRPKRSDCCAMCAARAAPATWVPLSARRSAQPRRHPDARRRAAGARAAIGCSTATGYRSRCWRRARCGFWKNSMPRRSGTRATRCCAGTYRRFSPTSADLRSAGRRRGRSGRRACAAPPAAEPAPRHATSPASRDSRPVWHRHAMSPGRARHWSSSCV